MGYHIFEPIFLDFQEKKLYFFAPMRVADPTPLEAYILDTKTKFKNRLDGGEDIHISYQPLPHMSL